MNDLSDAIFIAIAALIFFGIPLLILWPELFSGTNQPDQQKPVKSPQKPSKPKPRNVPSMDTIEALHLQADAERVIAEALEDKSKRTKDPVKLPEELKASLKALDEICRNATPQRVIKQRTIYEVNPETIKAMHKQADAERAIAEALEHKAQRTHDPVKLARLEKQIANSWVRFNRILDQIDRITEE